MADDKREDGKATGGSRPGVMGDGTEEQNLGQPGTPGARITEDEVKEAFGGQAAKEKKPEE